MQVGDAGDDRPVQALGVARGRVARHGEDRAAGIGLDQHRRAFAAQQPAGKIFGDVDDELHRADPQELGGFGLGVRFAKVLRFGGMKTHIGFDVFNLLNVNTVTSITTRSGATYGLTTTAAGNTTTLPFMPGRNVQFTLNFTF